MKKGKFDIWYDHQCIHTEEFDNIDYCEDMYADVILWWECYEEKENPEDYCVHLYVSSDEFEVDDEEEISVKEIGEIIGF